jgi:hypothetical protein
MDRRMNFDMEVGSLFRMHFLYKQRAATWLHTLEIVFRPVVVYKWPS